MDPIKELPYVTNNLQGVGGELRTCPEDFQVYEVPAYAPTGEGEHVFIYLEKCELTTLDVVAAFAQALGVKSRDIGYAGLKDKNAVTRQWFSLPPPCSPKMASGVNIPGVRVLETLRHPHKLRTGHLRGNRFDLVLRNTCFEEAKAAEMAKDCLEQLALAPGSPNWYGQQRFGRNQQNATIGREILMGCANERFLKDKRKKRLFVSAFQSFLFNEALRRRLDDGCFRQVLEGDVLKKVDSGGMFGCSGAAVDQLRLENGEVVATGPIYGYRMKGPEPGTFVWQQEEALLAEHQLTRESFRIVGKLGVGTRRPFAIRVENTAVAPIGRRAIQVGFELPKGAFATVVMRELMKC